MQNLFLLKASTEHLGMLQRLSTQTFIDTYAQFNTEEDMRNYIATEFSDDKLLADINSPYASFYFAKEDNEPVGYIKVNYTPSQTDVNDGKSLELERIYVLKEHQGKKIGQFLLDAALDITAKNNLDYLWLGVWDKNTNAQQFYAKNGFTAFGTHDFILGSDRQRDILLRLDVAE